MKDTKFCAAIHPGLKMRCVYEAGHPGVHSTEEPNDQIEEPAPQSSQIVRYADSAMYRSEEMPFNVNEVGPQVTLLNATPFPLGSIAATAKVYKGEIVRNLNDVTREEREDYFAQIQKTHLKMPFETVNLHFLIEGVTRAFTHQIIRQRTAAYAQESLRFAVKEGDFSDEHAMPPSIAELKPDDPRRVIWQGGVEDDVWRYNALVNAGIPAEDARGRLSHDITTRLHYLTNLRGLAEHGGNRLCTQAQFEWRSVFSKIIEAISGYCSLVRCSSLHDFDGCDNWEWRKIATLFRPICYATGKCEFNASFDRPCSIRDRVEANHAVGRTSGKWHLPLVMDFETAESGKGQNIPPIFPEEWLMDHRSARVPS